MRLPCRRVWIAAAVALAWATAPSSAASKDLDPAFLAMKDCPDQPGCPAIVLLEELSLNNEGFQSKYTYRRVMKLFTQDGIEQYGDATARANLGEFSISDFEGKTILPDGSEIPIRREHIQVKFVREGKRLHKIKSVTMPGLVPGAIIDYSYGFRTEALSILTDLTWEPQKEIPVLKSSFSLRGGDLKWGLRKFGSDGVVIRSESPYKGLEVHTAVSVPPWPNEPMGPPPFATRTRLYFGLPELQERWLASYAGKMAGWAGRFIQAAPGVAEKVLEIAPVTEAPGERVRRIYKYVQEQIDNEEARAERTGAEESKDAENAGAVLAHGYGDEMERTLTFLAMVREAGFEHSLLLIAGRRTSRLSEDLVDEDQFDSFAAAVKVGGAWGFYDPGTRHCPYGMVAAEKESGSIYNVLKIVPNKLEGALRKVTIQDKLNSEEHAMGIYQIAAIPFSQAGRNVLMREANVRLEPGGAAVVAVTDAGTGLVDLDHRDTYERLTPEKRKERLADELRRLDGRAELTTAEFEAIDSFEKNATLRYEFRLPGFAGNAADRIVLTPSLFHASQDYPFAAETRRTEVHLAHTSKSTELIRIALPEGYEVEEMPMPAVLRDPPLVFTIGYAVDEGTLVVTRRVEIGNAFWAVADYPRLKAFFGALRDADRRSIALKKSGAP